jgi:hypothetical protein
MLKEQRYLYIIVLLLLVCFSSYAMGLESQPFSGEGRALITSDPSEVQYKAKNEATIEALKMALRRILGPDALNDSRVQQRLKDIASQLSAYKIKQTFSSRREGNDYVVNTELTVDESKLQKLISDMGIAINTAAVRSNRFLTIMDEYFTTPSDLEAVVPLREETVYQYDSDSKFNEKEGTSKKDTEAKASSNKDQGSTSVSAKGQSTGSISAKQQASGSFTGRQEDSGSASGRGGYSGAEGSIYGKTNANYASKGSVDAKGSQKGSLDAKYDEKQSLDVKDDRKNSQDSASLKKSSYDHSRNTDSSDSVHESYRHIKEYQLKADPSEKRYTLASLQSSFQSYDIRSLDGDLFKSKYFGKKITIDQLNNSDQLAKFAQFAKSDADYFAIGTSTIISNGRSENTGSHLCDGEVEMKVYSTKDGESIASETFSESAVGDSPDQCRANVAKKIGKKLGDAIASKIQESSKKRQIYGGEYTLFLRGNFTGPVKASFTRRFSQIQGVTRAMQRNAAGNEIEFVISYNGQADGLVDSVYTAMSGAFDNFNYQIAGNQIEFFPNNERPRLK